MLESSPGDPIIKTYLKDLQHLKSHQVTHGPEPARRSRIRSRFRSLEHPKGRVPRKLYERALLRELSLRGIAVCSQAAYSVSYKGGIGGEYLPDLVVENVLIVELRCVNRFAPTHLAQCLSYSKPPAGLASLLNFQHLGVPPSGPLDQC